MEYPSGKTLGFDPDDLGRPTEVTPYIAGVTYHRNGTPNIISRIDGPTTVTTLDSRQRVRDLDVSGNLVNLRYAD